MTIRRMEQTAIVVGDLDEAVGFFAELGLERIGSDTVEGPWVDAVVGLEGVRSDIAMMQTPDEHGRVELICYRHPVSAPLAADPPSNALGLRHVAFSVDDLDEVLGRLRARGVELVGEIAETGGVYRLCYVRGPSGVIVMLAESIG